MSSSGGLRPAVGCSIALEICNWAKLRSVYPTDKFISESERFWDLILLWWLSEDQNVCLHWLGKILSGILQRLKIINRIRPWLNEQTELVGYFCLSAPRGSTCLSASINSACSGMVHVNTFFLLVSRRHRWCACHFFLISAFSHNVTRLSFSFHVYVKEALYWKQGSLSWVSFDESRNHLFFFVVA